MMFHPTKAPQMGKPVIGASDPATGFAVTTNITGGSPKMVAVALLTNVLGGMSQSGIITKPVEQVVRQVVGSTTLGNTSDADIRSLLAFKS